MVAVKQLSFDILLPFAPLAFPGNMMNERELLAGHRWVRIMCDFSAHGVWDIKGRACSADSLPVSDTLRLRIRAWQAWYDKDGDPTDKTSGPFDVNVFSAEGREIAKSVKWELPDWTVIYHDEEIDPASKSAS